MLVTSQGHGTGRAAVRAGRYALICKVCVYFHSERFHPHVSFFSSPCLPVMSNIHAFLPAATFLQSCFLTQFVLLATLPGLVSLLKNSFPLCNILALFFIYYFFHWFLTVFVSRTQTTHVGNTELPFSFSFYNPL